jgi:putative ABC transport system permease protein
MFSNYFKIAWRQLLSNKLYSIIKIGGLSASIAFTILVALFIKNEFTFDSFHQDIENIYRVELEVNQELAKARGTHVRLFSNNQEVSKSASISPGFGPAIKSNIPGIESFTRYQSTNGAVKVNEQVFQEDIQLVDKNFLEFFSFKIIDGDSKNTYQTNNDCVITKQLAEKYFGLASAIGKTIEVKAYDDFVTYFVKAVLEDVPINSSIEYSVLIPIQQNPNLTEEETNFAELNTSNFIKLNPSVDVASFKDNLDLVSRRLLEGVWSNGTFEETADPSNRTVILSVSNMTDIYLKPEIVSHELSSNPSNSYILSGIAILILLVACTNYISIALASTAKRSIEVGVRKVMGARKLEITKQFLSESILVAFVSTFIGIILAEALLPTFNSLIGSKVLISLKSDFSILFISIITALTVGVISGLYPGLIMSRLNSISAINKARSTRFKVRFTYYLVGFQFALSSFLIISALIMSQQMDFITNKDIGYDPDNVVVLPLYGSSVSANQIVNRMKKELSNEFGIEEVSGTSLAFGSGMSMTLLSNNDEKVWTYFYSVDYNFIPTMDIKLFNGRNFSIDNVSDGENSIIINETLANKMGIKNAGTILPKFDQAQEPYNVIAIARDFNFQSLLHDVNPMFINLGAKNDAFKFAMIKLSDYDNEKAIQAISASLNRNAPDIPFKYYMLEEVLENQYTRVTHWQKVVNASTLFAVFIAILGLFGITGLQAVNKTKEIGIRKVLGAGLKDIILLVNRNILITSGIAFIIATPVSVIIIKNWLNEFAYKIELGTDLFVFAAFITLVIGILTVAFHSVKAVLTNPVDTIKTE